jgi:thioredoxin-like negative regulator of GroEL
MDNDLELFLRNHAGLVLVNLWEDDCVASAYMEQFMGELERHSRIPILRLMLTEHQDWARVHGVYGTPALIVYYEGKPLCRFMGRVTPTELLQYLQDFDL